MQRHRGRNNIALQQNNVAIIIKLGNANKFYFKSVRLTLGFDAVICDLPIMTSTQLGLSLH